MKNVFSSHAEVCHIWAQRSQQSGNAGNIFFEGPTLYSYGNHYKLAVFLDTDLVLVNSLGYSSSTGKHLTHTWRAIPSFAKSFCVPELGAYGREPSQDEHKTNLKYYKAEFEGLLLKASRARLNGEWLLENAKGYLEKATAYALAFKLKRYMWKASALQLEALEGKNLKEYSKADRLRRQKEAKIQDRKTARKVKQQAEKLKVMKTEWLEGLHHSSAIASYPDTLMRIKGDDVQTSKGAVFSVFSALNAFRFVQAVVRRGLEWKRNGKTFSVGPHYQIDLISKNGDVKAGCHFIRFSEIERLGKLLEVL